MAAFFKSIVLIARKCAKIFIKCAKVGLHNF